MGRSRHSLLVIAIATVAACVFGQLLTAFISGIVVRPQSRAMRGVAASAPQETKAGSTDAAHMDSWSLTSMVGISCALAALATAANRRRIPAGATTPQAAKRSVIQLHAVPSGGYCESAESCVRRKTRTVEIGAVKVGSEHPIATQTMATTLTSDVEATVAQVKRCADDGIDIVRLTVQGMREAKACEHIKRRLLEDGYTTPLVADIHFTPKVALVAAEHVDKIRVNPGNFVDGRKSFDTMSELTEDDVRQAQEAIEEALAPLVLKLKAKNKAMRIGVNHGSLSERILFQYGDSPEGMVASAMEFGDICRKYDYHNFIFSMKSSNPQVMVRAYRLLSREMYARGWDYPIHLGVTEAGGGSDGRIKSAVGIGALLIDGIGDTIRVSLTENPELEVRPCIALRSVAEHAHGTGVPPFEEGPERREGKYTRRGQVNFPLDIPLNTDGSVLARVSAEELQKLDLQGLCDRLGLRLRKDGDVQKDWTSVDAVVLDGSITPAVKEQLQLLLNTPVGVLCKPGAGDIPDGCTLIHNVEDVQSPLTERLGGHALVCSGTESIERLEAAATNASPRMLLFRPDRLDGRTFVGRNFFAKLAKSEMLKKVPVLLWFQYTAGSFQDEDDAVIRASAEFGSLFVDGLGEGLLWDTDSLDDLTLRESSFNLLQASRMRVSKTEFISCPSCGRTLFDLQETTAMIKARTGHLPGVRIAIMGCIVNGPGEMADADFGYVGSGVGKIDLYVGYDCVKRAIPSDIAVDKLVELMKEHGRWQDPPSEDSDSLPEPAAMANA